jgi:hypothetical protein
MVYTYFNSGVFQLHDALILSQEDPLAWGVRYQGKINALVVINRDTIHFLDRLEHHSTSSSAHYWRWPDESVEGETL